MNWWVNSFQFFLMSILNYTMFIVFTQPNKFTKTYNEAVEIADAHYELTGEIVAVEETTHIPTSL